MNTEKKERPLVGGCAIIVKDPKIWSWGMLTQYSTGIAEGSVESESGSVSVTFNYRAFKNDKYCSCSGGPSITGVPIKCFRDTGMDMTVTFWKWGVGGLCASKGVEYTEVVPIFEWYLPMPKRRG